MRGRRADPAAVKEAKGNPGRRPIGEAPSAPVLSAGEISAAPEWLNAEAAAIWSRLAPDLAAMRLLSKADVLAFARYCDLFAKWLNAGRQLEGQELVVITKSAHVTMERLNGWLKVQLLLEKRLVDLEDRFGLNPSNRQRIFALRAAGAGRGLDPGGLFDDPPAQSEHKPEAAAPSQGPIGLLN